MRLSEFEHRDDVICGRAANSDISQYIVFCHHGAGLKIEERKLGHSHLVEVSPHTALPVLAEICCISVSLPKAEIDWIMLTVLLYLLIVLYRLSQMHVSQSSNKLQKSASNAIKSK